MTESNTVIRNELRSELRAARSRISPTEVTSRSAALARNLHPLLSQATHIAGYLAIGSEVDLTPIRSSLTTEQHFYVPVVKPGNQLIFTRLQEDTPLIPGSFGILEPVVDASGGVDITALDVVLVPLVGFDRHCNRMGMGGGYYDRAFAHRREPSSLPTKPLLIGVAYDQQEAPSVFPDWWDVTLDHIVTESRTLNRPA